MRQLLTMRRRFAPVSSLVVVGLFGVVAGCASDEVVGQGPTTSRAPADSSSGNAIPETPGATSTTSVTADVSNGPGSVPDASGRPGFCVFPTTVCVSRAGAAEWWPDDETLFTLAPVDRPGFREQFAVLSASEQGLDADPRAPDSMLLTFFIPEAVSDDAATSGDALFDAGGIVVQAHLVAREDYEPPSPGGSLDQGGVRRDAVTIRGREGILEQTTDPPTGVNGFMLTWTEQRTATTDELTVIEVLVGSKAFSRAEFLTLVERLEVL